MAKRISLAVVTPERLVLDEIVDDVALPGLAGELGVLPEHTYLLSILETGVLAYHQDGEKKVLAISGGYAEVTPERVTVLAEGAEKPEEIDMERARLAREHALKELKMGKEEIDFIQAQAKLNKAMVQLRVAALGREGAPE